MTAWNNLVEGHPKGIFLQGNIEIDPVVSDKKTFIVFYMDI